MKKQLLAAVAATALMAMPSLASADDQGWYVRGNVGYGTMTEMDLSGGLNGAVQGEGNVAGSLGLGYAFGNNWRLELDAAQLWNDLGSVDQIPNSYAKMRTNTAMLNAIYDFSDMGSWTPYVGAGIGFGQSKLNAAAHNSAGHYLLNTNTPACFTDTCKVNDTDTGLAWQLIAGLGYDISERLVWDTQYRYVDLGGLDFLGSGGINGVAGHFNSQVSGANEHILMTGLRYKFGGVAPKKMKRVEPVTVACWDGSSAASLAACPVEAPRVVYTSCWDGSQVESGSACPARPVVQCWDGSTVSDAAACPVQRTVTCWDGSLASDATTCRPQPSIQCSDGSYVSDAAFCAIRTTTTTLNVCGPSSVAIFNVPVNTTGKSVNRLGTLPEFGDSHGLTSTQFYEKLATRHASNSFDRKYLDYLFRSMGYSNGFADAHAGLFSEDVLAQGTSGMLGFGKYHGYAFSVLNTNDRDRQAFRIQGANGQVVHFMKTCGNYMYACQ
ncbi:MAG: hypothetical protein COA43_16090 [Robiginitomaculum sp.]|nr:MAG: hypothetical protein COA43_16090 [Robiginitomaculum sp.]